MSDEETKSDSKRAYESPRIEESAPFEELRLGCTFQPGPCDDFEIPSTS